MGRKKAYADIVLHGNQKLHNVRTESSHFHMIRNGDVRPNYIVVIMTQTCGVTVSRKICEVM